MSKIECSLGDLISYISRGIAPKYTEDFDNSCIVLNQKCIRNYVIDYIPSRRNNLQLRRLSGEKYIKKYDVLVNSTGVGTLGRTAQFLEDKNNIVVDSHVTIVRPDIKKINPLFFGYLVKAKQSEIESLAEGSTGQTELSRDALRNIQLKFIADINLQREFAEFLLSIDKKIQLNTQINQTLEQIAQTIFKSWFIDFDPVHAKANALASGQTLEQVTQAAMAVISGKNTQELHRLQTANPEQYQQLWEIAEAFPSGVDEEGVPWGWESKSLDEIAIYQNGLALQKFRPESEDEYLPVVKIAQLKQGYADGKEKASVNIKPECIIDNGDVIFSWSGSLVVDIWCGGKAALNQHLFKVTSKNYPKWLYYFYTVHHLAEFQRIAADKAVTMGHIKREHLSLALCVIPNNEFIQKFCFLEDYISQIVNNRLQNVSLIKIRDELLPKLLSGEILNGN